MKAGSEWSSSTLRQHNYLLELVSRYRCDGTQRIGLHAQRLVNRDSPIPLHIFIPSCCSPARGDLVAALGETTGQWAFQRIHSRMQADATGRRILADRPRVTVLPPPPQLHRSVIMHKYQQSEVYCACSAALYHLHLLVGKQYQYNNDWWGLKWEY